MDLVNSIKENLEKDRKILTESIKPKLEKGERIICPAIWIDDKQDYSNEPDLNIPKNIETGFIKPGSDIVDILFKIKKDPLINYINYNKNKLNEFHEGYYTNHKRFIKHWINY